MRTIKRDIVGAFIFSSDGKLLLGNNRAGGVYENLWVVPGGGVDPGETLEQALIREISEEIGIDISDAIIERIQQEPHTAQAEKTLRETGERIIADMKFYDFKVTLGALATEVAFKIEDDFGRAEWFAQDEVTKLNLADPTRKTLQNIAFLQ